jgi:hypothetical protein
MKDIRDKPKLDSLVDGIFDELVAHPEAPIMVVLGSVGFRDIGIFSEPIDSYRPAFLRFYRDGNRLKLDGHLKDVGGFTLIEFSGDYLHFNTRDTWDIERRARYLKLYSKTQRLWFELTQNDDLSVTVDGEIYAGGTIISISKSGGIRFPEGGGFSNLTIEGNNAPGNFAIGLPVSPMPRPIGHVDPNARH